MIIIMTIRYKNRLRKYFLVVYDITKIFSRGKTYRNKEEHISFQQFRGAAKGDYKERSPHID